MTNKEGVGIIVGRFQVDELTEAHKKLLDHAADRHEYIIVFLGVAPVPNKRNPLNYWLRSRMVWQYLYSRSNKDTTTSLQALPDNQSDTAWVRDLDTRITTTAAGFGDKIVLYGGSDSFIKTYKNNGGRYKTETITKTPNGHATDLREEISKHPIDSVDFRRGVIHATQNRFDAYYPTVDIACIKEGKILLGRKPTDPHDMWRLPGGFVDPKKDSRLESAASRELYEETHISIHPNDLKYVFSIDVKDWRYRDNDRIMTTVFQGCPIMWEHKAADDLEEVRWLTLNDINHNIDIVPVHQNIVKRIQELNAVKS